MKYFQYPILVSVVSSAHSISFLFPIQCSPGPLLSVTLSRFHSGSVNVSLPSCLSILVYGCSIAAASPLFTRTTSDELLVGQVGCVSPLPQIIFITSTLSPQQRDWNEEFQSTKELPATSFIQKLFKDRTQFKIHTDFLQTAIKGSIAAVDGHLHPLNAADPKK